MKVKLKTGKIIEVIKNDDFSAAKYINKETSEYVYDDEIDSFMVETIEEFPSGPGPLYDAGYAEGFKAAIEKASSWLRDRVNIPYDVKTNESGEPMADSYIDYCKKRLEIANEIVDEFKKYMSEK